jgi:meso-butanediol dehydrogenase/(S,S)-butanediol dehydrogenase/diacetyl reductase
VGRSLENKVAVVTGGGRGIGLGITNALSARGAKVIVAQRSWYSSSDSPNIEYRSLDVISADNISCCIAEIAATFGRIDILVNNAGMMFEKTVEETSEADWDGMLSVNLKSPFLLIKAVVPLMKAKGGGSIINIGSIEGLASNPGHPAYSASKAGLHGLTAAVAVDHGRDGIRCNAIAPGWIASEMSEIYLSKMNNYDRVRRELLMMHPVGRLGTPADVGELAAWLASDESSFVTGQVLVIDGGRTKKLPIPASE